MREKILAEIIKVVKECGAVIRDVNQQSLSIKEKTSTRDVVTEYDIETQNKIINHLSEKFPNSGFVSEESQHDTFPDNELVFIIDPIDGTMNFAKGMQYSCISVACFKNHQPYIGVVYNPYLDELYAAVKDNGAFCNDQPIHVTDKPLNESLVICGTSSYYPELLDDTLNNLRIILPKSIDVRIMGSAALDICQVAAGRAGVFFESRICLWDYAAAAIILEEAGGVIRDLNGNPISYNIEKTSIITGTDGIIRETGLIVN